MAISYPQVCSIVYLQPGLVVVVVEELVYDQEGCPVSSVCVNQKGEGSEAVGTIAVSIIEGGEGEHENYLSNAEDYLGDCCTKCGDLLEPGTLLGADEVLSVRYLYWDTHDDHSEIIRIRKNNNFSTSAVLRGVVTV